MPVKPPITPAQLPEGWTEACREAMRHHEGVPVRAGATLNEIEAFSIKRNTWMPILLPGGGTTFETAEQRDEVLGKLEGK